jgi:hypothetical protein
MSIIAALPFAFMSYRYDAAPFFRMRRTEHGTKTL